MLFNFFQILQSGTNCLKQLDRDNLYVYKDSGSFSLYNQKCKKGLQNLSLFDEQTEQDMILKGMQTLLMQIRIIQELLN